MACACSDLILSCADENAVGSFLKLWVIPFDEIVSFTASTSDHSFTAVTTTSTAACFIEVQGKIDNKSYASETIDSAGRAVQNRTISVVVPKLDKEKAFILECLRECRVVVILEDYQGEAFVVGYDDLLKADAALKLAISESKEATIEGLNAYTLLFTGKSIEIARQYCGSFETSAGTKTFTC